MPGHSHHIVQRGYNRQLVFAERSDYEYYLASLRELKELCGIKVFSYCMMDCEWSSFQQRIGAKLAWLDSDPCFNSLGSPEAEARSRYGEFVEGGIPDAEYDLIRQAVQRNQLTGSGKFVDAIEATLGLRIERRGPGRPRTEDKSTHLSLGRL